MSGIMWIQIVHVASVAIYVGGVFFMDVLLTPALNLIPPAQAAIVSRRVGRDFALMAWASLILIAITGVLLLYLNGMISARLFTTSYGWWLLLKLLFGLTLLVNGLLMTLWLRPRMEAMLPPGAPESALKAKQAEIMSASNALNLLVRIDLIVAGIALIVGVGLEFGGLF